jgi:hypothetical protein
MPGMAFGKTATLRPVTYASPDNDPEEDPATPILPAAPATTAAIRDFQTPIGTPPVQLAEGARNLGASQCLEILADLFD